MDAEEADPLPVKRDLETQAYAGAAMRYHHNTCTIYLHCNLHVTPSGTTRYHQNGSAPPAPAPPVLGDPLNHKSGSVQEPGEGGLRRPAPRCVMTGDLRAKVAK